MSTLRSRICGAPKVKVCGVRSPEEALLAAELGADLIGLNFHPPSPRYLEIGAAREIAEAVKAALPAAGEPLLGRGVRASHSRPRPRRSAKRSASTSSSCTATPTRRRWRPSPRARWSRCGFEVRPAAAELAPWREIGVWGMLLDTRHPGLYGGTGQSWNFATVGRHRQAQANGC